MNAQIRPLPRPIELTYRTWGSYGQHEEDILILEKADGTKLTWRITRANFAKGTYNIKSRHIPELQGTLEISDSRKNFNRKAIITAVPADVTRILVMYEYCSSRRCERHYYEYDFETGELKLVEHPVETIETE